MSGNEKKDGGLVIRFEPSKKPRVRGGLCRPSSSRICLHSDMVVDKQARKVKCGDCDADLDPISCLDVLAHAAVEDDWKARQYWEIASLLYWLVKQGNGRLVVTNSRAEARVGSVVKTASGDRRRECGLDLERVLNALRSAKETADWIAKKSPGEGAGNG